MGGHRKKMSTGSEHPRSSTLTTESDKHCQKTPSITLRVQAAELPEICINTELSRREFCDEKHNKEISKDNRSIHHNSKNPSVNRSNASKSSVRFEDVSKPAPDSSQSCREPSKNARLQESIGAQRSNGQGKKRAGLAKQTQASSRRPGLSSMLRSSPSQNKDNRTASKSKRSAKKCSFLRSLINLESRDDKASFESFVSSNGRVSRRIESLKSSPQRFKSTYKVYSGMFSNNNNESNSRNSNRPERKRLSRNDETRTRRVTLGEFFDRRIRQRQLRAQRTCLADKNSQLHSNNSNTINVVEGVVDVDKENGNRGLSSSKAGIFCRNISSGLRQIASNIFGDEKFGITCEREMNSKLCEIPSFRCSEQFRSSTSPFASIKHDFNQINRETSRPDKVRKSHLRKFCLHSSNANVDISPPLDSDSEAAEVESNLPICLKASEGYHDCRIVKVIHDQTASNEESYSSIEDIRNRKSKRISTDKTWGHRTASRNGNASATDDTTSDEDVTTNTLVKQTQFPPEIMEAQRSNDAQLEQQPLKILKLNLKQGITDITTFSENEGLEKSTAQESSQHQGFKEIEKSPEKNQTPESGTRMGVPRPVETMPKRLQGRMSPPKDTYTTVRSLLPRPAETMPQKLKTKVTSIKQTQVPSKVIEGVNSADLLISTDPESKAPSKSDLAQGKFSRHKVLTTPHEGSPEKTKTRQVTTEVVPGKSERGDRSVHFECSFHNMDTAGMGQNRSILGCSSFHCLRKRHGDSKSPQKSDLGREFYRFFDKNNKENEVIIKILSKQVAEILRGQTGESSYKELTIAKSSESPKKREHKYTGNTESKDNLKVQENKNERVAIDSLDDQKVSREEQKTWPKDRMRLIELPATMSQNPSQSHRYHTEQTLILTQASEDCRMPGTCFRTGTIDQIPSKVQQLSNNPSQTFRQLDMTPKYQPQKVTHQLSLNSRPAYPPVNQEQTHISTIQKFHLFNPNHRSATQVQRPNDLKNTHTSPNLVSQAIAKIERPPDFRDPQVNRGGVARIVPQPHQPTDFSGLRTDHGLAPTSSQAHGPTDFRVGQTDQNGIQFYDPESLPPLELEPGDSINIMPAFYGSQCCPCCCYPGCCHYSWRPGFCSSACSGYCVLSPCK